MDGAGEGGLIPSDQEQVPGDPSGLRQTTAEPWGVAVPSVRRGQAPGSLRPTAVTTELEYAVSIPAHPQEATAGPWGRLGPLRPTRGSSGSPGPLGSPAGDSGPWTPRGRGSLGALVTGAVGADDAGEPLERADDLAASPRLEILHEQQLQAAHGCAPRLSRFLVRPGEGEKSAGRTFFFPLSLARLARAREAPLLSNRGWRSPERRIPALELVEASRLPVAARTDLLSKLLRALLPGAVACLFL